MNPFDDFISKLPSSQLVTLSYHLRDQLMEYPVMRELKKFNLPFYFGKTWICYLNLIKNKEIELVFVRAIELPSNELLNFKNRVMAGGLTYACKEDVDDGILRLLIQEALDLDDKVPYSFKKKK